MKIVSLEEAPRVPFNLDGRRLLTGRSIEIIHLSVKPKEAVERHTNPFDVFFYILGGRGTIEIEDESIEVRPDLGIEIPRGRKRGIRNDGDEPLKLLVVKLF